MQLKSQIGSENTKKTSVGKITNGGFEQAIDPQKTEIFEWQIAKGNQPKIGINEQNHEGEKSLAIVFNSLTGKEFRQISQIVAIESEESYEFEAFYKSKLETSATVKWEIADVLSGKVLASTDAIEKESDWKSLSVRFTTPEDSEGVIIRLVREKCTSADCSIKGTVWLDSVSLN